MRFNILFLLSVVGFCSAVPLTQCPCGQIIYTTNHAGILGSYKRILPEEINDDHFHFAPKDGYCYQTIEYEVTPSIINITIQYNRIGEFEDRLQEGMPNSVEFGSIVKLALRCNSIESCLALSTKEIKNLTNNFVVYHKNNRVDLSDVELSHLTLLSDFLKSMRESLLRPPRTVSHDHNFIPEMRHFSEEIAAAQYKSVEEPPEVNVEATCAQEEEESLGQCKASNS